jgi:hypothetical protein
MTLRFGLKDTTIAKIGGAPAVHPPIEKAVLYGSRAKGTYKNGPDIDLTLEGGALTHPLLRQRMGEIDDLLWPDTIDLSFYKNIDNPDLIAHIQRVGIIFCEKATARPETANA